MKLQVKEFADLTGVSVRTLHYYDAIGLLKPAEVDPHTGYRYYDAASLLRIQEILFYRELEFPLKSIADILTSPDYDKRAVMEEQKQLLTLKKDRLEKLIAALDAAAKGENIMNAFDKHQTDAYRAEVKERWGDTAAYAEYNEKSKNYSKDKFSAMAEGMDAVMAEFALYLKREAAPESSEVQEQVRALQNFITENFYHCTHQILAGLGEMYVADERFKNNIDRHADGNAEFIRDAIRIYCGSQNY